MDLGLYGGIYVRSIPVALRPFLTTRALERLASVTSSNSSITLLRCSLMALLAAEGPRSAKPLEF
jgi:hypothetical protein